MKKAAALTLSLVLTASLLAGCGKKAEPEATPTTEAVATPEPTKEATPEPTKEPTAEPTAEPTPIPEDTLAANTVFDAFDEFDLTSPTGDNGPWLYSFTTDAGKTFDPCTILEATGGLNPWHPWGGNWTGVGLNADVANYVELNTDSKDGISGALGFKAPADGNYGIAGSGYNPWGQPADLMYCVVNGQQLFTSELGSSDTGAYLFPYTTVSLKAGDIVYFYCPSTEVDGWVSAYMKVKVAYEPTSEPEIYVEPVEEAVEVEFVVPEGAYNSVAEFDQTSATGENGVWVYSFTKDEGETFQPCAVMQPGDGFIPWRAADGEYTGVGINPDPKVANRLELNTDKLGGTYGALGFKAPEAGDYTITGLVGNPWGQTAEQLHARLNGEDLFTVVPGGSDTGDASLPETTVTLNEGDIIYFYCPSTSDGWVSTYVAVAVVKAE